MAGSWGGVRRGNPRKETRHRHRTENGQSKHVEERYMTGTSRFVALGELTHVDRVRYRTKGTKRLEDKRPANNGLMVLHSKLTLCKMPRAAIIGVYQEG